MLFHMSRKDTANDYFIFYKLVMRTKKKEQKLIAITINNNLNFGSHIKKSCKKVSRKIGISSMFSNHLNDSKKKISF